MCSFKKLTWFDLIAVLLLQQTEATADRKELLDQHKCSASQVYLEMSFGNVMKCHLILQELIHTGEVSEALDIDILLVAQALHPKLLS